MDESGKTVCNCKICNVSCKHNPGFLVPEDLKIIPEVLGMSESLPIFMQDYILGSAGFFLGEGIDIPTKAPFLVPMRIPVLVPKRVNYDEYNQPIDCIFLKAKKCSLGEHAPAGCRRVNRHLDSRTPQYPNPIYLLIQEILNDSNYLEKARIKFILGPRAPMPEMCTMRVYEEVLKLSKKTPIRPKT
jgi:hypothetical protein